MVSAKPLLVVACAAMLVLAGCSGGPGTTDAGTTTAPDGPGDTETTAGDGDGGDGGDGAETGFDELDTPQWMTADGIDGSKLLTAHHRSLDDQSYRVETYQNSSGLLSMTRNRTSKVGADGTEIYEAEVQTEQEDSTTRAYVNDSWVFLEQKNATRTVYSDFRVGPEGSPLNDSDQLVEYVRLGDYSVNRTFEENGETRIEYVADSAADVQGAGSITEFDGRIVVSPDGRVHTIEVSATQEAQYGNATSTFEYDLAKVGDVDVSTPDWVATAREEATTVDFEYAYNGSVIEITHEGGDTVKAGAQVVVSPTDGQGFAFVELSEDFSAGETLYVAADGGRELLAQKGSAPAPTGTLGPSLQFSIYGEHNEIVVQSTVEKTTNGSVGSVDAVAPWVVGDADRPVV